MILSVDDSSFHPVNSADDIEAHFVGPLDNLSMTFFLQAIFAGTPGGTAPVGAARACRAGSSFQQSWRTPRGTGGIDDAPATRVRSIPS